MIDTGIINMFYFYAINGGAPSVRHRIRLKGIRVDPEVLREAVSKATDRNEYFGLTPVLDPNGIVYFENNQAPVSVYPDDNTYVDLGTDESDGYLFRTLYTETSIAVSHFHALTDARGSLAFLKSVLYYYLTLTGHTISREGILCEDPADPSEQDILTNQIPEEGELLQVEIPGEVFVIPVENTLGKTPYNRRVDLTFSAKELIAITKEYNTTPVPFVSVMTGQAIDRLYDVGDQTIVSSVLVDMHEMQGSRSLSNYCCNVLLPLDASARAQDIQTAIDDQKAWMKRVNTSENLFAKLNALKKMEPVIRKTPLNDPKYLLQAMKRDSEVAKASATYFITNIGRVSFPEDMLPYLDADSYEFFSTNTGANPVIAMTSAGDTGHIYVTLNNENKDLAEMLCTVLNENGLHATSHDLGNLRVDNVIPARFSSAR